MNSPIHRFEGFELRPSERTLQRDGEPVVLRARAFDVLLTLVERAGSLVTKADLLDRVWPGLVVEENNIAAQVAALRKAIGSDLVATIPGHGYRFMATVHTVAADQATPASHPTATLPATPIVPAAGTAASGARLFGRTEDLSRLRAALATPGCVTLVGPGGVGKTSLARAVAAQWPATTVWVDLAAIAAGEHVVDALARRLGLAGLAEGERLDPALLRALAGASILLVLDNAEHVVDAVAALVRKLADALPTLAILVTSQVPLHIAAERVIHVEPLRLPADEDADAAALGTAAVEMLVDRVRAADHRFALGAEALPQLRRISAQLDGLPLALEMAATRIPVLGLDAVLQGLDHRFAMLTRGLRSAHDRHKTLRGALEWSHGLLDADEQVLFRRLAVFTDGFSLDLAVATAAETRDDRWMCIDVLSQLVERSLVTSAQIEPPRYRLLETMRAFALESLAASGEENEIRSRLADALIALMHRSQEAPGDRALAAAAAAELGNVPGTLHVLRSRDPARAIALTLAASSVATWTPWRGNAARWIEAGESSLEALPKPVQAQWWTELARHQSFHRGPRTVEAARRAAAMQRDLGNDLGLFWALVPQLRSRLLDAPAFEACRDEAQGLLDRHPEWPARLGILLQGSLALEYRRRSEFESALHHQRAELELAKRHRDELAPETVDNALVNLAGTLTGLGRHGEALDLMDELLARYGAQTGGVAAQARIQRLHALIGLGRLDDAAAAGREALHAGLRVDAPNVLEALGLLALQRGRVEAAVQWIGRYRGYHEERGAELPEDAHAAWHHVLAAARIALDEPTLAALMARGAALDADGLAELIADAPSASPINAR